MLFKTQYLQTPGQSRDNGTNQHIWLASLLLLVGFAACQLLLAIERSPSPDDAMFLSVPKNWLSGYGWATSYSEKIPFNPDFTGPTALLLLAAPLIELFGNQLWIAGVTGLLANLMLLGLCLQQIRQYWQHSGMASLALVAGCFASMPEDFASLIGYYSGSLLFLLACLIAFNPYYSTTRRALLIGLLLAIGLLVKLLLLPAFMVLLVMWLSCLARQDQLAVRQLLPILLCLLLPVLLLDGFWYWYRQQTLSAYSAEFLQAHADYGREFFLYHGSGVGQWQDAGNKWLHLYGNVSRNLYQLEVMLTRHGIRNPFIGTESADIHHVAATVFLAGLILLTAKSFSILRSHAQSATAWLACTLGMTTLVYTGWFLLFAMAMSPGHLYFPMQWSLWLFLLLLARLFKDWQAAHSPFAQKLLASAMTGFAIFAIMPPESRDTLLQRDTLPTSTGQLQAAEYLQSRDFPEPLAGCSYGGYPRHLEYLLPGSQHFADCLDLVEDQVEQSADGHYHWKGPVAFNVVLSLQSAGLNSAAAMLLDRCKDHVRYRNHEVLVFACSAADLHALDLDKLMTEIRTNQHWYRTRLMPFEGHYFQVLKQ